MKGVVSDQFSFIETTEPRNPFLKEIEDAQNSRT